MTLEGNVWSRKNEEYVVDFLNVTRRALSEEDWKIFNYHYLLGADWRMCTRKLGIDRGRFFHEIYRITERLGRVYRELYPYPLFPLDEYFHGTTREQGRLIEFRDARRERPSFTPPLREVA